jgi:PAS domain S-box-containing protein
MISQDKTKEQLLIELAQVKNEISKLYMAERKHITEALSQECELYLDLANALPSGIYRLRVFHSEGISEEKWFSSNDAPYTIEFVNDRFCEILNLDKQDFISRPGIINDFIVEPDRTEFIRKNVEANLNKIPFIWEGRFKIKNELIWVHFESVPRSLENKDIIWTGILNDISERKKTEQEIKFKNQELQKVNAEKDKFFSILAHDLKGPFNSIVGFSNILAEQVHRKDIESIKHFVDIIRNSSLRAMNLLMNLMEWAQSQSGRMNFNPEYFEMNNLIKEVLLLFSDIAIQKSVIITKELPVEIPVYADKAMIGTVLRNLVSNAVKFTKPGGSINISAEVKQNILKVSISDTGIGISKSSLEAVFQADANLVTFDTQNEKGTGLGLILCKEFIEKHKGKIWVESDLGQGSVFYFTIPCNAYQDNKIESNNLM